MRSLFCTAALVVCGATAASAQQRDTTNVPDSTRSRSDTARAGPARPDSAAIRDSLKLIEEMRRIQGEPRVPATPATPQASQGGAAGPTNPRLLPDISAVGDLVGDLSPDGSTQADGTRFGVREVEIAVQAAVDPYFRGDVFLGISDLEKISIEQAYLTATALPYGLEVRLGRYLMPVGKQNTTHRHDLHTIEYPWVIQRFLSDDGLKGTGIWVSKIFAPFEFYQELQLTGVDRFGEPNDTLTLTEPVNKTLGGMAYSARLRNYIDLSEAANVEISATALTGRREQPLAFGLPSPSDVPTGVAARQSILGADLTYRWRPLQQGLYRSFIVQAEFMRQINEKRPAIPSSAPGASYAGPGRDFNGAYAFARYQLTQRLFLGSRYDWLQDPEEAGTTFNAASGYLAWFPSEFSQLVAGYERLMPSAAGTKDVDRLLFQASFALGPHKPHPF